MIVQELPIPQLNNGMVMVRNHYSLISAGTEGSTVKAARQSLVGKAKARPEQVKQVLQVLKTSGVVQTYRAITKKLEAYSPLGYSCAGEVIEVADDVKEFKVGDFVACGGATACHAEIVCVPVNLTVKLRNDADLSLACYNTLGAIALQGVRQADLRLGETCAVIGLGLVGQIVCNLLKASGVRVIGVDVQSDPVKQAAKHCAELAIVRNTVGIENKISDFSGGLGVDAVIIAAATSSLDPINFAGTICRKKGTVVVLGAVPTGFERSAYYKKELQLKMSCSYGPGRYDLNYEEKGIDYPASYVRWTEKRNMEAFQELLYSKKIDLSYLTTHHFKFEEAPHAYDVITNRSEPFLGIVLRYDTHKEIVNSPVIVNSASEATKDISVSFIGAGNYAQGLLLPNLPEDISRKGVMTNSGATAKRVAERFNFEFCTSNEEDILKSEDTNTLFVATRHDSHASYILKGLENGKNVYSEKPLCLNIDELMSIKNKCESTGKSVMVGFNRRFAPLAQIIKKKFGDGKMSMIYRVNTGVIPADSWTQDSQIGGGRIIGEGCHFIDFMSFMCGSIPIKVSAVALPDNMGLNDTVNILIQFENGSTGVLAYYANGSKSLPKEYVEVYCSGQTAVLNDFRECVLFGNGKPEKHKLLTQNKGQKEMLLSYFDGLKSGAQPIPMRDVFAVTAATFGAMKSLQEGGAMINISL